MNTRIGHEYREIKRKDGSTMVVRVERVAAAKLDLCTRQKRKSSKRVRVARRSRP